jgi:O-antigen ligase
MLTQPFMHHPASRIPGWLVVGLLALPWIAPWAPGPQSNTVPLLLSWGVLAVLLILQRLPSALELAQAWACAALLSSAMGLLQYFGEAGALGGWVHGAGHLGEAMGNLRQRNQLATLTSIGVVAVLWWHARGLRTTPALGMVALLALGNAATGSRTGLLQWLLLPALSGLWQALAPARRPVWSWPVLLGGLAVYLLGSLALPHMLGTWRGAEISNAMVRMGEDNGCGSRSVLWGNVLHLIGQHPWTGWGWGELKYAHYMASYPGLRFCDILGNAHNLPLHLAFAFGVPATLLALGSVLVLVLRARP